MRARHNLQLRKGVLHTRRTSPRGRDPRNQQEERLEGDRRSRSPARG